MKTLFSTTLSLVLTFAATAQGVKIGDTQGSPDASAILEAQSSSKGFLPPRLTTAERDAISNPANGLLIYNTTTKCYEGYEASNAAWVSFGCLCPFPMVISAAVNPNPVCEGSTLTLSGLTTGATSWSWTGPNGFTSSVQNPTIPNVTSGAAGIYTLTVGNACAQSSSATTASVTVLPVPTVATAGADQNVACGNTTTTLAANAPVVGIGSWSVVSGAATITDPSSPTSGVTGLAISGTAVLRWTIANDCASSYDDVTLTTTVCPFVCGTNTVTDADNNTYNTVLIGSQCWMKENLNTGTFVSVGTTQTNNGTIEKHCQNLSGVADATCPLGGLYQWNEMMNYQASCNGSGAPPNDKCSTPVQGICPTGWHIPSHYEWTTLEKNVGSNPAAFYYNTTANGWLGTDEGGNLKATNSWNSPNAGATNSSGFTALPAGASDGGSFGGAFDTGLWWSSTESGSNAWRRYLDYSSAQEGRDQSDKTRGYAVRCLRD